MKTVRAIVLDTSAFIMGYEAGDVNEKQYTVPTVLDELSNGSFPKIRLENAVITGRLQVITPGKESEEKVKIILEKMGETAALSLTDKQILSLGLQLEMEGYAVVIVSDDYGVQNISDSLGLNFRSLATRGIKKRIEWQIYCPGCRKIFNKPQEDNICTICGTSLKRRPKRRT